MNARHSFFCSLFYYKRKQTEESSVFDGIRERALILGSDPGTLVTHNLAVWIQKFLQDFYILVIYVFYIVG